MKSSAAGKKQGQVSDFGVWFESDKLIVVRVPWSVIREGGAFEMKALFYFNF